MCVCECVCGACGGCPFRTVGNSGLHSAFRPAPPSKNVTEVMLVHRNTRPVRDACVRGLSLLNEHTGTKSLTVYIIATGRSVHVLPISNTVHV